MAVGQPGATAPALLDGYLHKFRLYETRSKFYLIGRSKNRALWRVLKIDRLEPSELNVREDTTSYSERECHDLLKRIHEGNRATGGLKFVTNCYGIVGFVKFLGPYYMLLITKRKQIGVICGHLVYTITKSEMIVLPNSSVQSSVVNSKHENRYKKLLCTVDLTKDFFFSYSYHVMRSLQRNLCDGETGKVLYETMFVWNEFLTRGIRNHLNNTLWTVALVYGFFKQAKLSISGRDFRLTLIARRSRHFAGTRYLKRGVNEKGRVANDVETEQIVFEDTPEGIPTHLTSIVQNRGSIPLFWSQETSRLNLRPDIILQKRDNNYEATRLHFDNLMKRYGSPIIILNLIKTREKKPRELILREEFANAIDFINKDLPEENRLKFLHWDLHKHSRSKGTNVLISLGKVASYATNLTGFFYCQVPPTIGLDGALHWPLVVKCNNGVLCNNHINNKKNGLDEANVSTNGSEENYVENNDNSTTGVAEENNGISLIKPTTLQKGVLRTNCIDCLDRTNVAQYAYGLAALGHQLHAVGLLDVPKIDLDAPLADDLMSFYEKMGDTLALQYGGSAAHNKIFCERRGQWKAATQSQEFFRTLQRYYSNAYMDAVKQDAINVFLGHFQPQDGKPSLWELDSGQDYDIGRRGFAEEHAGSIIKKSLSDGNILCERGSTPSSSCNSGKIQLPYSPFPDRMHQVGDAKGLSESTPEISTCESDISYSRFTPTMPHRQLFAESEHSYFSGHGIDDSNFLDLDWLSSSGNCYEEEIYGRSTLINSPTENLSTENFTNDVTVQMSPAVSENGSTIKRRESTKSQLSYDDTENSLREFSDQFVHWVLYGETLCY